jgi:hypothetical protein
LVPLHFSAQPVAAEFSLGEFRELPQEKLSYSVAEVLEYLPHRWRSVFVLM